MQILIVKKKVIQHQYLIKYLFFYTQKKGLNIKVQAQKPFNYYETKTYIYSYFIALNILFAVSQAHSLRGS